jgi:hypothetical protein
MTSRYFADFLKLHDESTLRDRIRTNLIDWASEIMGHSGLFPSAHHRSLLNNLDLVTRGEIQRLIVLMPPGSAKSTYVSINTDLWGQYVPTPASVGTWYAWAEGTDGSAPTVYSTPFTVT